jgi:hypothetical protein
VEKTKINANGMPVGLDGDDAGRQPHHRVDQKEGETN